MSALNQFVAGNMPILLLVAVALLCWSVLRRGSMYKKVSSEVAASLDEKTRQLEKATKQHAEVLTVVEQLDGMKKLSSCDIDRLRQTPAMVTEAVLLSRMTMLQNDLNYAEKVLSNARRDYRPRSTRLATAEQRVEYIDKKLRAVITTYNKLYVHTV